MGFDWLINSFQSSFYALKDWIKEIKRYGPSECVVAIAGNKCDLEDQREVGNLQLRHDEAFKAHSPLNGMGQYISKTYIQDGRMIVS